MTTATITCTRCNVWSITSTDVAEAIRLCDDHQDRCTPQDGA